MTCSAHHLRWSAFPGLKGDETRLVAPSGNQTLVINQLNNCHLLRSADSAKAYVEAAPQRHECRHNLYCTPLNAAQITVELNGQDMDWG